MKVWVFSVLLAVAAAWSLGDEIVDGVVAVVNGHVITLSDLDREVALTLAERQLSEEERRVLRRRVLDKLVELRLILEVAAKEQIILDSRDELDVAAIIENDIRAHNTKAQFVQDLRAIGFSEADYRQRVRNEVLAQKTTARKVFEDPFIQPGDLRDFYDAHRFRFKVESKIVVRHLMLSKKAWSEAELQNRLAKVEASLAQGVPLSELVPAYSDGPRKAEGGIWELKTPQDFIDPLGEVVFKLEEGQVSSVLTSHLGYHVIEVLQREDEHFLNFSEVQIEVERELRKERWNTNFQRWIAELRSRAFVEIYLE